MKWIKIFESKESAFSLLQDNIPYPIIIGNTRICIVRKTEKLYAFKEQCPHSGASLSNGFVNQEHEIVCPLHGYRFSMKDGREKSGHSCKLFQYGLDLKDDGLYLGYR